MNLHTLSATALLGLTLACSAPGPAPVAPSSSFARFTLMFET